MFIFLRYVCQYEQAADAELAWVAETKRKLMALGPPPGAGPDHSSAAGSEGVRHWHSHSVLS